MKITHKITAVTTCGTWLPLQLPALLVCHDHQQSPNTAHNQVMGKHGQEFITIE